MTAEHELRISNAAGVEQIRISNNKSGSEPAAQSGFQSISCVQQVNAPGLLVFALNGDHEIIDSLAQDWQINLWRRNEAESIAWYTEFEGLFRDEVRSTDENGLTTFQAICPGNLDLLARSIVAYPAGTDERSSFSADPAETVLKNLVTYNATTAGTTGDGRDRNVDAWGAFVSVEADGAGGNTITRSYARRNLLTALQDVAAIAGGDFELDKTGDRAWEFKWHSGQLGTDRSASITFALQWGNMGTPTLVRNRINEGTVVIVGGQGEEADRTIVTRTGTNYQATTNSREVFVNASQHTTAAGLNSAGDKRLDEMEARDNITFEVIQVSDFLYGADYFLGDLITSYFQGVTATQQISGVTLDVNPSNPTIETITFELKNA